MLGGHHAYENILLLLFTILILTLMTLGGSAMTLAGSATEIRVRNDSDVDFKDVVVGGKKYGDIKSGATTDYQTWKTAYRYSPVTLIAGSKPMQIQPIDYLGERELGTGHFTYVLTVRGGQLDIRVERDED
jgi:hypothetical protein